ncbi:tetratricopeptide repeat protein [Verrucomicrobiaceae bacterium 227]
MSEIEELYEELEEAQELDQVASACILYEEILTLEDEENVQATLLYVTDLIDLGNTGQAEATLLRIEELCEGDVESDWHAAFGQLNHYRGRYEDAEKNYRAAHELRTDRGDYLVLAAASAFQRGEAAKAEYLVREALKYQCEQDEAYSNLGTYLASQRRFEEAAGCFREVLKIDSGHEFAREWLADLEQVIGD